MDLNLDPESNNIDVVLNKIDIQTILEGGVVSESIKRGLGHLVISVTTSKIKTFNEDLPIGDAFYAKKLSTQVASGRAHGTMVDVNIPRILIAANQSQTEYIPRPVQSRSEPSAFNGSLTVRLPDLDGIYINNIDNVNEP